MVWMRRGRLTSGGVGVLVLAATLLVAAPVRAARVPWSDEPLAYTVVDQELRELLAEIGVRLGVSVRVSDAVKARVRGRLPAAPPREFLDRLASIYGFEWFYDGGVLWVSAVSESQSRILQLGPVPFEQVAATMDELGLSDTRWPLRGSSQAGIVMVNGPPRFLTMAEQVLTALQQRAHGPVLFRGKTVSAR